MGFRKTFRCLGRNREWEDQEKGDAHLEAGDQPFKTSSCSPAFSSSLTCVQLTWAWPGYSENLGSRTASSHRSDYWDNPAWFIFVAFLLLPPLVFLLISPRNIVYQMCCYYTEEDLVIPSFSAAHFWTEYRIPSCSLLYYRNIIRLSIRDKG